MRHYIPRAYVPGTSTVLLTEARKMPCASWSLPAREACPYALNGEGTICGSCYADKGSYTQYPNVKRAQRARFAWVRESLKTDAGTDDFVRTMVDVIRRTRNPYFRVHDSGDLFSPAYTWAWVRIVQSLPDVKFWFPTRSWRPPIYRQPKGLQRHDRRLQRHDQPRATPRLPPAGRLGSHLVCPRSRAALMTDMPVTRRELAEVLHELRTELTDTRQALRQDIGGVRRELSDLRQAFDQRMDGFQRALNRITFVIGGAMFLLLLTQIYVLLRLPS